jgi:hypothetical protein
MGLQATNGDEVLGNATYNQSRVCSLPLAHDGALQVAARVGADGILEVEPLGRVVSRKS